MTNSNYVYSTQIYRIVISCSSRIIIIIIHIATDAVENTTCKFYITDYFHDFRPDKVKFLESQLLDTAATV